MSGATYLIGLGSNRRHDRHGPPRGVLAAALEALARQGLSVLVRSPLFDTAPLGPGGRAFANAAAIVAGPPDPRAMLAMLKATERAFGRRRGRRWGDRVLDLDILLWSGGAWPDRLRWRAARDLAVPHRGLAARAFVLDPAARVAAAWRDPLSGRTVAHLRARLRKPRPVDPAASTP